MERRPPGESKLIVPTQAEQAKVATPGLDPRVLAGIVEEFIGKVKPAPRMKHLDVHVGPRHTLSEDGRKARRVKNRTKRVKPSHGRSRGRSTWMATAKAKHKAQREG